MIWGVYASTYISVNLIATTCERSKVDAQWPKFLGTTVVNMTTCITKVNQCSVFARVVRGLHIILNEVAASALRPLHVEYL